jgi:hypothetical protein
MILNERFDMKITRRSPWSNKLNTIEVDITQDQLNELKSGKHIKEVAPDLHVSMQEFVANGFVPNDWLDMFKDDLAKVDSKQ